MDEKQLIIQTGENFSARELKDRLRIMNISYDSKNEKKGYLINLYDDSLKSESNKLKLFDKLLLDTQELWKRKNQKRDLLDKRTDTIEDEANLELKLNNHVGRLVIPRKINENINKNNNDLDIQGNSENLTDKREESKKIHSRKSLIYLEEIVPLKKDEQNLNNFIYTEKTNDLKSDYILNSLTNNLNENRTDVFVKNSQSFNN